MVSALKLCCEDTIHLSRSLFLFQFNQVWVMTFKMHFFSSAIRDFILYSSNFFACDIHQQVAERENGIQTLCVSHAWKDISSTSCTPLPAEPAGHFKVQVLWRLKKSLWGLIAAIPPCHCGLLRLGACASETLHIRTVDMLCVASQLWQCRCYMRTEHSPCQPSCDEIS